MQPAASECGRARGKEDRADEQASLESEQGGESRDASWPGSGRAHQGFSPFLPGYPKDVLLLKLH